MTRAPYPYSPDPARGPHARIWSGRCWHFLDPDPTAVWIGDVAHHLAFKGRWFGGMDQLYTVAQHAVLVSSLVETSARDMSQDVQRAAALTALHHDDDEAFLPDIASPLKKLLVDWTAIATASVDAICAGLAVPSQGWDMIHHFDKRIREDEVRCLASAPFRAHWQRDAEPLGIVIEPWSCERAEAAFLARHRMLGGIEGTAP